MTDSERQQILKMIADGKITPEQGLTLMQALENVPADDDPQALPEPEVIGGGPASSIGEGEAEKNARQAFFAKKVNRFRRLWMIPLVLGLLVTIGAASWMYASLEAVGMNFWFYCAWFPFALGVAFTALALSSRESRWLYLNVKQKPGEKPSRIVISFPMSLVTWLFNMFGHRMPENERLRTDLMMQAFTQSITSDEPILIEVDDEDGEKVQVYIG